AVAQCPPGNVTFSNQAQVDNFLTAYPNCTQINGSVFIDPSSTGPISNLNGLQNIETITGSVIVTENSSTISNLNGLNSLKHIGGDLFISDTWITNISGLSDLEYVGGNVEIISNHIGDFSPLNNLTYLGGDFKLSNDAMYCAALGLNLQLTHNSRRRVFQCELQYRRLFTAGPVAVGGWRFDACQSECNGSCRT